MENRSGTISHALQSEIYVTID